jgi:hypothetical protein
MGKTYLINFYHLSSLDLKSVELLKKSIDYL